MDALIAVIISANSEWQAVLKHYSPSDVLISPFGGYFFSQINQKSILFVQGGWGKVSAAASVQYVIDTWHPQLIINPGTCAGLQGQVSAGEIILVDETVFYDVYERMGDPDEAIRFYTTPLDLSFLHEPYPQPVRRGRLASADQDIDPQMVATLREEFKVVAADWESAAIAWVVTRNQTPCLILRGVSDLVGPAGGEIYNDDAVQFNDRAGQVMSSLLDALPDWIGCVKINL